jgi:hypothetical protein
VVVNEENVEATELVISVVEVDTVETTVDVEVVEKRPPNGENLSIVERGFLNPMSAK